MFLEGVLTVTERVIAAIVIVLVGLIVGQIVGRLLSFLLKELEVHKPLRWLGVHMNIEMPITLLVRYVIYLFALGFATKVLGLLSAVRLIILSGVLLLAIMFLVTATVEFFPNLLVGLWLRWKGVIVRGKQVGYVGIRGRIIRLKLGETCIERENGDVFAVPHRSIESWLQQ